MLICQNVNSENEQGYRTGDVSKHEETILSTALFSFFHDAPRGEGEEARTEKGKDSREIDKKHT